jgi:flagellar hook-associated protein 1 FlgK
MSSVDLNEEGVNLLQYSKSYNAAARLMTTLDEMLETLINRISEGNINSLCQRSS